MDNILHNNYVTEDDKDIIDEWYEKARHVTRETLQDFITEVMDKHGHDYGAYCHAVAVCSIATSYACGQELTGFQASIVSLLYPLHWYYYNNKCGISLRNWDDMLYPQYEHEFEKTISKGIWNNLQKEAQRILNEEETLLCPSVKAHLKSISLGNVPFGYRIVDDEF